MRSRLRRAHGNRLWANECVRALNEIYGKGDSFDDHSLRPSACQRACLDQIRNTFANVPAPESCNPVEAYEALCGQRPGYSDLPQERANYRRELVSLPDPGATAADGELLLKGRDLHAWSSWRHVLVRSPAAAASAQRQLGIDQPYTDPRLLNHPGAYAKFLKDLADRSRVSFSSFRAASVGTCFVKKKGGSSVSY